jgi:hypothetical protein
MDKHAHLRKVIIDFKKLTPEVLKLTVERYPDGYDDLDIISFRNANGERIEAVEAKADSVSEIQQDIAVIKIQIATMQQDIEEIKDLLRD